MIRVSKNPKHLTEEIVSEWHMKELDHTRWFVFTDNRHSFINNPTRKGQGQAQVRGLEGTLSIFTKESYVYREQRARFNRNQWNKDYDSLALFQKHNTPRLKEIEELSKSSTEEHIQEVVLPQQFGGDRAFMTSACATWLANKLNDFVPYHSRYEVICVQGQAGCYIKSVISA